MHTFAKEALWCSLTAAIFVLGIGAYVAWSFHAHGYAHLYMSVLLIALLMIIVAAIFVHLWWSRRPKRRQPARRRRSRPTPEWIHTRSQQEYVAMDKIKSTRFIVAMNAVLLSMLILGHLGASPLGSTAEASAPPKTPVNAATQRQRMIVALEEMNKSSKASRTALDAVSKKLDTSIELQRDLIRMLERGKAIVTVSNMDTGGHN